LRLPLAWRASGTSSAGIPSASWTGSFIRRTREQITPGTSALFVLTSDAVVDRVQDAFAGSRAELLFTNLSTEQETALREAFAD
jgi:uncharacterized membrane protein